MWADVTEPGTYSYRRYLDAKRTVDERALDRRVAERLRAELAGVSPPLDVLEVGAGTGATIERVATWDALPDRVRYTAVDIDPDLVARARTRLLDGTGNRPFEAHERDGAVVLEREEGTVVVDPVVRDAFEFVEETDREWDLLVAQAFLDTTDVREALATFGGAVTSGGLLYVPITFDGGTILEPPIDPAFDRRVERRYHHQIDTRGESGDEGGDARAGRHLLTALPALGGAVVAAGSSDWVVVPDADGYPADEAYFLHHIIETIRDALDDDPALDSARFDEWIETRHRQVEDGRLVYVAHQLDVLGRSP